MTDAPFEDDIPFDVAQRAHAGTSHTPEVRATSERAGYAATLQRDWSSFADGATPEQMAILVDEFARYRAGYRTRYLAMLQAKARCMSTMITGGSNFPVRRQRKLSDSADRHTTELIEFRTRALTAIRRAVHPELAPIMAGDVDAVERIDAKLTAAETQQELMVKTNRAIRANAKFGPERQIDALVDLGHARSTAALLLQPDELGRIGFADYQIKNNAANIRRMKMRGETIAEAKSVEDVTIEGVNARLVDSSSENRVRLFYSDKPDAAVRAGLKSAGFRWTPSLGCWQAYRNPRSLETARRKAGIES